MHAYAQFIFWRIAAAYGAAKARYWQARYERAARLLGEAR